MKSETRLLRGLLGVGAGAVVALINCMILTALYKESDMGTLFSIPRLLYSMSHPVYEQGLGSYYTMSPLQELFFLQAMFLPSIIGLIAGLAKDDWSDWWKILAFTLISIAVNIVLEILLESIMLYRSGEYLRCIFMVGVLVALCVGGPRVVVIIVEQG